MAFVRGIERKHAAARRALAAGKLSPQERRARLQQLEQRAAGFHAQRAQSEETRRSAVGLPNRAPLPGVAVGLDAPRRPLGGSRGLG